MNGYDNDAHTAFMHVIYKFVQLCYALLSHNMAVVRLMLKYVNHNAHYFVVSLALAKVVVSQI